MTDGLYGLIRIDIKTHLCSVCTYSSDACEVKFVYGNGVGSHEGMPNIAACDGFEPSLIGRTSKSAKTDLASG